MLSEAEDRYGQRDLAWTPIGVEFFECNVPHVWFPGDRKYVCIRLTLGALNDLNEALWQLAQEIVHVLGPVRNANKLEEGVATHFALNVQDLSQDLRAAHRVRMERSESEYSGPLKDYESLLSLDENVVAKLRQKQPYLSSVTAQDIFDLLPTCDPALAARLTTPFP